MTRNVPLHADGQHAMMRYRILKDQLGRDGLDLHDYIALDAVVEQDVLRTLALTCESLEGIRAITGSSIGLRGQHPERLRRQAVRRREVVVPLTRTA